MAALTLRLMVLLFQVLWTITTVIKLGIGILCNPRAMFKKKSRIIPPSCLIDPSLGDHHYVTANGIKFHYVSKGDNSKPLMLLLHGYPEFWYSWRYQLNEFSRDYHVVAVDMRGYGESDKPVGVDQYSIDKLTEDIIQLVQVLSPERKCILVGHDWGGVLGWQSVCHRPDLFEKYIVMNCPHPRVFRRHITTWKQLMSSWYMFMFQTPRLPEFIISLRDYGMFNALYRGRKAGLRNRENFTEETLEAFKYTFSQKGALTPPINYIRNIFNAGPRRGPRKPIEIPVLLIWGEGDMFLDSGMVDQHDDETICSNLTIKRIPNCSHWVQQDCPELTNQYMKEFLE